MRARISQKQIKARQAHLENLKVGNGSPVSGNCEADTTKETLNQRVSLPDGRTQRDGRTREGSPLGEAAPSRSSVSEKGDRRGKTKQGSTDRLLEAAQTVFPARQVLYSFDVHGRRSEIDTSGMSEGAYQKLLEAFAHPIRVDGLELPMTTETVEHQQALAPGYRIGVATGLPIPDWWQIPEPGASVEQIKTILKENLQRAGERQGGFGWKRALGRAI